MSAKERPILFSAPMIRAILAGAKTQTRRVITSHKKAAPYFVIYADRDGGNHRPVYSDDGERGCYTDAQGYDVEEQIQCPYGAPGDRLWCRETWARDEEDGAMMYRADLGHEINADAWEQGRIEGSPRCRWHPSIHMPRWASRITLEVTGVRVERLQDISVDDCWAEGVTLDVAVPAKTQYARLWGSINGPGSWDANPFVWVITFAMVGG